MGTSLGDKLYRRRKELGLSQQALANGIMDRSYISRIERGQIIPPMEILEVLARGLGLPLESLSPPEGGHDALRNAHLKLKQAQRLRDVKLARDAWAEAVALKDHDFMVESTLVWLLIAPEAEDLVEALDRAYIYLLGSTVGMSSNLLRIGLSLGRSLYQRDGFMQATKVYQELLQRSPLKEDRVKVLVGGGSALYRLGQYETALRWFLDAAEGLPVAKNKDLEARVHHGLGICYRELGDREKSYHHTWLAHHLYQRGSLKWYETLHNLSILQVDRGQVDTAMRALSECWDFYCRTHAWQSAGLVAEEQARCAYLQGDFNIASQYIQDGLSRVSGHHPVTAGRLFLMLAMIEDAGRGDRRFQGLAYLAARNCLGKLTDTVLASFFPESSAGFVKRSQEAAGYPSDRPHP